MTVHEEIEAFWSSDRYQGRAEKIMESIEKAVGQIEAERLLLRGGAALMGTEDLRGLSPQEIYLTVSLMYAMMADFQDFIEAEGDV